MKVIYLLLAIVVAGVLSACGSSGVYYLSPSGADSPSCGSQSNPCRSMDYAAEKFGKDPVINMLPGTYPSQTIDDSVHTTGDCVDHLYDLKTTNCRTFLAHAGVVIDGITQKGSGVAITSGKRADRIVKGYYQPSGSQNLISKATILGEGSSSTSNNPPVYIGNATDVAVYDNEIKNQWNADLVDIYGGNQGNRNVKVINNDIHGAWINCSVSPKPHVDGVQLAGTTGPGGYGTLVKGNHIYDIDQNADIQVDSGQLGTNETIEGNTLDALNPKCGDVPRAFNVAGNNFTAKNNIVNEQILIYSGNGTISGNQFTKRGNNCSAGNWTWTNNTWSSSPICP